MFLYTDEEMSYVCLLPVSLFLLFFLQQPRVQSFPRFGTLFEPVILKLSGSTFRCHGDTTIVRQTANSMQKSEVDFLAQKETAKSWLQATVCSPVSCRTNLTCL